MSIFFTFVTIPNSTFSKTKLMFFKFSFFYIRIKKCKVMQQSLYRSTANYSFNNSGFKRYLIAAAYLKYTMLQGT